MAISEAAAAAASIISNNNNNNPCLFAPPLTNENEQQEQEQEALPPLPPPANNKKKKKKKKKKRNLPGTPDPDAEVVALSPRTLLATNRFVCEMCGKGFQREQNLQLHRRGHNLPWKLRVRGNEAGPRRRRKRVYVCPEATCVHHSPSRALGDLTGIKKHFCRKHGDKKWKCEQPWCGKRYAVQSDCKAHAKTCGTRQYRCDCGTLFARRDSFVTHRAFCDALALAGAGGALGLGLGTPVGAVPPQLMAPPPLGMGMGMGMGMGWLCGNNNNGSKQDTGSVPSVFSGLHHHHAMSATALLHKAAQMGAVTSSGAALAHDHHHSSHGGGLLFSATQQQQQQQQRGTDTLMLSQLNAVAAGNMPYDVLSAVRHAGLNKQDAAVPVGRDETRDFLGVAVQPLCSSSLNAWI